MLTQYDDGKWRRTVFRFSSEKINQLPIEDFSFYHRSLPEEQLGAKIGPVCFK
jgi:hypothetical protein